MVAQTYQKFVGQQRRYVICFRVSSTNEEKKKKKEVQIKRDNIKSFLINLLSPRALCRLLYTEELYIGRFKRAITTSSHRCGGGGGGSGVAAQLGYLTVSNGRR